ncbi:hypothetical protein JRO89_XS10G0156600 [Xanthoceras sorbifolium]|uniref:Cupin type-1 domain-containing protein n=1 Tax=Xanthoceras sorbifolium TaxID=99658 RepID=A0ABQ8HIX7_9ROSI|nr:hypothetical protein JRO89_XS10G0156600 [Xanthoceras sorbifolium]
MRSSNLFSLLLVVLVLCHGLALGRERFYREEEQEEEEEWDRPEREREWDVERGRGRGGGYDEERFLSRRSEQVVKTDAGEMRVVRSFGGRIVNRPMHVGFITMEPKTLFTPQYMDSSLILFIRRGTLSFWEARVGYIYEDDLAERRLKMGDVYRIAAGSTFYLENIGEGQRLHIICSIDPSESLGMGMEAFQSFYISGGTYPSASVLSGFHPETLANAFNVSQEEVAEMFDRKMDGPIMYVSDSHSPKLWAKFVQMKEQDRLQQLKRMVEFEKEPQEGEGEEEEIISWSWRKLLNSIFGTSVNKNEREDRETRKERGTSKGPDSYNIYDRKPDFRNDYGWSIALDKSDYKPLKHSGIGIYLVNLTAGSMMAPHVNPTATEYGVVLGGSGRIQIVYPNGTTAMDTKVKEGDVFWVPSSLLRTLPYPELAAAFGVSVDRMRNFSEAQREAVILPSAGAAPPDKEGAVEVEADLKFERVPNVIKSFGHDMVMGFD